MFDKSGETVRVYLDGVGNRTISLVHCGVDAFSITIPMEEESHLRIDFSTLCAEETPPYIHKMGLVESMTSLRGRKPVAEFTVEEVLSGGAEYPWHEADGEEAEDQEGQ